ncbi:MAG: hypothetical protein UW19_C0035G0004 [Candidatus Moranbacteria bacterium GW2011_GWF2_44_10]|nr:MAG: hypothetical protein UW19_C0035G0004 [Candidatus Moranbacteria bacterium GW2011_GWF2_44_10]
MISNNYVISSIGGQELRNFLNSSKIGSSIPIGNVRLAELFEIRAYFPDAFFQKGFYGLPTRLVDQI